ncbi:VirK family protein [Phyllobacterium phragmitis]|uniref:VirK family protein n=1 Tax=Phyllobacterium phragmitis TaxID=2670329 RepID=UPI0038B3DDA1
MAISFLKFRGKGTRTGYSRLQFCQIGRYRSLLHSAGLAAGLVGMNAQASEFAHTFYQLKMALLDARPVTAILDLALCHDAKGRAGPHIRGGFLIPSFMIIENQGTARIAFSLTHETVEKQTNKLHTEFVRYIVRANNSISVEAFSYFSRASGATPANSWTCSIDKGVRFGW